VEDDIGLLWDKRYANAVPIEEAWEVSSEENTRIFSSKNVVPMEGAREVNLKENIRIFDNMEEVALSISDMQKGMKIVPYMKRREWCGRNRELVNHVGKNIVEGKIVACDPKEPVLDDDLGEIDVGVTILNCLKDKLLIMSIWKWPLS
jgi:hypothetical protein